ncbi:thiamine-phosphate kinase [Vibrio ostreicida]|uniref:thiamine-phosphate kinase n=1 Tax=Vibrio ostreicida TaxID=526588 RepID=UPI000970C288|nr:thiamine-phosphate kinase [Vibrio ostreicida]
MTGEFNLIEQFFIGRQSLRKDVLLAAGDDCALVNVPENQSLAVSTDTLVAGTHFLNSADPALVAHKALVSNLSDLAAMGATPAWVSLAITMPEPDQDWLSSFCDAFFELADAYNIQLIGGDTTKGPLSLTLTVHGWVDPSKALRRDGAQIGDGVYVTGDLGDSQAGLDVILNTELKSQPYADLLEQRHYLSTPQVLIGQALLGLANAAIDISDGLTSDLTHILQRSKVGASIDVSQLPISNELVKYCGSRAKAQQYALSSGEEYQLCFTVPEQHKQALEAALAHFDSKITCIGQIVSQNEIKLHHQGRAVDWRLQGYDHFENK